jgi:lysophospholipase L1-like esterase
MADTLKIMPMGDSITAGYHTMTGYRLPLQKLLSNAGYTCDFVGRSIDRSENMADPEHEGYSGITIHNLASMADAAMQLFHPDVVLLCVGTNDTRDNGNNSNPKDVNYWQTAPERLDALITQLNKVQPGVKVIVGNLMLFSKGWAYANSRVDAFNARLPAIIAKHKALGENVFLADLHSDLSESDFSDGIHPNSRGYTKMAHVWFTAIQQVEPIGVKKPR